MEEKASRYPSLSGQSCSRFFFIVKDITGTIGEDWKGQFENNIMPILILIIALRWCTRISLVFGNTSRMRYVGIRGYNACNFLSNGSEKKETENKVDAMRVTKLVNLEKSVHVRSLHYVWSFPGSLTSCQRKVLKVRKLFGAFCLALFFLDCLCSDVIFWCMI